MRIYVPESYLLGLDAARLGRLVDRLRRRRDVERGRSLEESRGLNEGLVS
jgi:hypothetical protein